jgi:glycerol-3-phosphate dehydrogenase
MLKDARAMADLGECLGADLYARELAFLRETEWAATAEDVLWRRTKLGLFLTSERRARIAKLLEGCMIISA